MGVVLLRWIIKIPTITEPDRVVARQPFVEYWVSATTSEVAGGGKTVSCNFVPRRTRSGQWCGAVAVR